MIKSTDIPNGVVFKGSKGELLLMDFDDAGNLLADVRCMSRVPDVPGKVSRDVCSNNPLNILTFVHTVKGEEQMLVRDIFSVILVDKLKKPLSVYNALKLGRLIPTATNIRRDYVVELEKAEEKAKELVK
jgi:hypothetical protein